MLVSQIKSAIEQLKVSIDDLAYDATLIKRTADTYVPGQTVTYTETSYTLKTVVTNYDHKEIDLDRIQINDAKLIVFNSSSSIIPEPNDTINIGSLTYRVIRNQPIYAGSEIVLSVIQARPVT